MDFSDFEVSDYTRALLNLQCGGNRLERCSEDVLTVLEQNSPDLARQIKLLRAGRQRVVDEAAEKTRREGDAARRQADVAARLAQAEIQIRAQKEAIEHARLPGQTPLVGDQEKFLAALGDAKVTAALRKNLVELNRIKAEDERP
jgi:hypothetical protein